MKDVHNLALVPELSCQCLIRTGTGAGLESGHHD